MNEMLLTTDTVCREARLEYWTDLICNVYVQLGCEAAPSDDFSGAIRSQTLPDLDLSIVRSGPQNVSRTPGHIARATDDYFLVNIQTLGTGVVRQDGRDAVLAPGDFALYDSTRPYELVFAGEFEQFVLKLPGKRLRGVLRDAEKLTATTVSGSAGAGRLLGEMTKALWTGAGAMQPASAWSVTNGVVNVLVAGLQTLPDARRPGLTNLTDYHLAQIKRLIAEQLSDPGLSVSSVASDLGLSVGHVHRIFKNEPTSLTRYIWERRLDACSSDLLDPRLAGRAVGDIAYSRGFSDAAHFSRAFKERFGCSPREWRHRAATRADTAGIRDGP